MPKLDQYLIAAKESLILALAPYKREIREQPKISKAASKQNPTELAVYTSSLFPDGINKRLQAIHQTIGEVRRNDEGNANINSMIKHHNTQTVESLIDMIIELEKVLLPFPGLPPVKRSLEAHLLNAIDNLVSAALTLDSNPMINYKIFWLANEYDDNDDPEIAEQLYLIALQRDYRINEGDSSPFSRMVSEFLSKESLASFYLHQKKADLRPLPRPFSTFVEQRSQVQLLLDFGVARTFSNSEPAAEEAPEQRKKQKVNDTREKPQPSPSTEGIEDIAKFLASFQ